MVPRTFDNLPDEVILHIFIKGCEEVSDPTIPFQESARRRKPVVKVARQVCKRWRALIDGYPSIRSKSFWAAYIKLAVRDRILRDPSDPTSAQSITTFRHQLESSKGSDLIIYFRIQLVGTFYELYDFTSPPTLAVRLITNAMEFMRPYHSQITTVRLQANHPRICFHLLDLIANRWDRAHRLTEITIDESTFRQPEAQTQVPRVLGGLLGPPVIKFPVSFAHLPNLDTLVVPVTSWLTKDSSLQIPMTIDHLKIMNAHEGSLFDLYRFLTENPLLHPTIKSIILGWRPLIPSDGSKWNWNENNWVVPRPIILPSLHSLTLHGATGEELGNFFHSSYFPLLDTISLGIFEEDKSKQRQRGRTSTPFTQLSPLDRVQAAMSNSKIKQDIHKHPQMPQLQKLEIWLISPSTTLSFLSIFAGWPIETVSIKGHPEVVFPDELATNDTWVQGLSRLHNFCPRHLELGFPFPLGDSIIKSINTRFLQSFRDARTSLTFTFDSHQR